MLYEAATRLVTVHVPPPTPDDLAKAIVEVGQDLVSLGVVACHDPGGVAPDQDLTYSFPIYARLAESGRLPLRVHACLRDDALTAAIEQGHRSGRILGQNPEGRARVGWQKCFADGSLGSRTAALLADIEPEPDRPLPPDQRRGVWMTEPEVLAERVARAASAGITSTIHAIGDAAVRAALDVLTPGAATASLMPRIEHVQMLHPADRGRFAAAGIAASVQPVHLGSDAAQARKVVGRPRGIERLHVEVDRRHRGGHAVRDRRAGRVVRPVARPRPGRASGGPTLAGRRHPSSPKTSH